MPLIIYKAARKDQQRQNAAYLNPDNWDDFGHKTLFSLSVFDERGNELPIGSVKIGFVNQGGGRTEEQIPPRFDALPENFYSLGQDADYYRNIVEMLSPETAANLLVSLRDVVHDPDCLRIAENETAFNTSLLRSVHRNSIENQFRRILRHEAPLTPYDFFYEKRTNDRYAGIRVQFAVTPDSKPSTNIHVLIGRNGIGKTTLLNNMVDALVPGRGQIEDTGYFAAARGWAGIAELPDDYFAGVVSVSFSAFDPFTPPDDQPDANAGIRYHYVGLKKRIARPDEAQNLWALKDRPDLCRDFTKSLSIIYALIAKRTRWIRAVRKLESDFNFAEMDLTQLEDFYTRDLTDAKRHFTERASSLFDRMSSGHAVVLLTITRLVETVEEKTLVLLDEPESHLHPPLLSAFTRALSDLLTNRNGMAIVATHSPVVLQEVPKSCVSLLRRNRLVANVDRLEGETFAENVGILTREVFGLEVSKSGYHSLLRNSVDEGLTYEQIEDQYQYQLGFEGQTLLRTMIVIRDSQGEDLE